MFKHRTLVGNWAEERDREEELIKEYMDKKAKGEASVANRSSWMERNTRPATLTYNEDMILRYGSVALLRNQKTKRFLAVSVDEKPTDRCNDFTVSGTTRHTPQARNSFIILPESGDLDTNKPVCFGDKVCIAINPELFPEDMEMPHLYLESHVAALSNSSTRVPGFQPVSLRQRATDISPNNFFWIIEHQDPKLRLECEGEPIKSGDVILLRHSLYNRCLVSLDSMIRTDYGQEGEVGALTIYDMHRVEGMENRWSFILPLHE